MKQIRSLIKLNQTSNTMQIRKLSTPYFMSYLLIIPNQTSVANKLATRIKLTQMMADSRWSMKPDTVHQQHNVFTEDTTCICANHDPGTRAATATRPDSH